MPSRVAVGYEAADGDFHPDEAYLAAVREPFGEASVGLAIGPWRMALEGLAPEQARLLRARFEPFVTDCGPNVDLRVAARRAGVPAFLKFPPAGHAETYRLESRTSGRRIVLWSYEFAGWFDPTGRQAEVSLVEPEGPLFGWGMEIFLRVLVAFASLDLGAFLLHGAGIVRGGKAHLFFGPSGSGKTTACEMSPKDTVLSDDLTLVIRGRDGFEAAGIPFSLAHRRRPETRASYPIASFNRLVKGEEVVRVRLTGARALAEVLGSLPFVMCHPGQASRAVEVVGEALRTIPAYRLHFRKDDTFWDVVQEG